MTQTASQPAIWDVIPLHTMTRHLISIALLVFFYPSVAQACKCAGLLHYDVIFEGTAESIIIREQDVATDRYREIHFVVNKTLKGELSSRATVFTGPLDLCGIPYEQGKRYTVYATNKGYLETEYCYGRGNQK
jgi:hypothetical protein